MARTRRLTTDADFTEAMERGTSLRVFQDDHIVSSGGIIVRFDSATVVVQTGVGDISYFRRDGCEFFETRR